MHLKNSIRRVEQVFQTQHIDLPDTAGVYAFWWVGSKETLLQSNTQIILQGVNKQDVHIEYEAWWPDYLAYPCLYVGKSTNIKKRFSLHIKRRSPVTDKPPYRLHAACPNNKKAKPKTTSCQLRHGIEHLFPDEENPLSLIYESVDFSYCSDFQGNATTERFFEENRLIGSWRPWFNIDCER